VELSLRALKLSRSCGDCSIRELSCGQRSPNVLYSTPEMLTSLAELPVLASYEALTLERHPHESSAELRSLSQLLLRVAPFMSRAPCARMFALLKHPFAAVCLELLHRGSRLKL
jgi:hypothetical protein